MLKKTLGSNPVEWSDRHCGTWASASLPWPFYHRMPPWKATHPPPQGKGSWILFLRQEQEERLAPVNGVGRHQGVRPPS